MLSWFCRVVFLLLLIINANTVIAADKASLLNAMFNAWASRQKATHSGSFVWQTERTTFKNTIVLPGRLEPLPATDVTTRTDDTRLVFEADRISYRYHRTKYNMQPSKMQLSADVFDGDVAVNFKPLADHDHAQAIIFQEREFKERNNFNTWPVLLTYRPLAAQGPAFKKDEFAVEHDQLADLTSTTRLIALRRVPVGRQTFWVDQEKHYRITKMVQEVREAAQNKWCLNADLTIDYADQESSAGLPVPSSWKLVFYNPDGRPRSATLATVITHEINCQVPDDEFTLFPLPVGTIVEDLKAHTRWRQGKDGKRERLDRIEPEMREAPTVPLVWGMSKWRALSVGIAAITAVLFIFFIYYRRRYDAV